VIILSCVGIMIVVLCFVVRIIVLCVGITVTLLWYIIMVIVMCLGVMKNTVDSYCDNSIVFWY